MLAITTQQYGMKNVTTMILKVTHRTLLKKMTPLVAILVPYQHIHFTINATE